MTVRYLAQLDQYFSYLIAVRWNCSFVEDSNLFN